MMKMQADAQLINQVWEEVRRVVDQYDLVDEDPNQDNLNEIVCRLADWIADHQI